MPNNIVVSVVKFVWERRQFIADAIAFIRKFLKDNPDLVDWAKRRLASIAEGISAVKGMPSGSARVRGTAVLARREAEALQTESTGVPASASASWIQRADEIERALAVAEKSPEATQPEAIDSLTTDADQLVAEIIETVATSGRRLSKPTE